MFFHNAVLRLMVKMPIVQEIDVIAVLHSSMTAVGTVNVGVVFVCVTHFLSFSKV